MAKKTGRITPEALNTGSSDKEEVKKVSVGNAELPEVKSMEELEKESKNSEVEALRKQVAELSKVVSDVIKSKEVKEEVGVDGKPIDSSLMAKIIDKKDMERKKALVARLEKQEKVMMMIPPDGKVNSTHEVGINGVVFIYPKGVMLQVPMTIGKLLSDHFNVTMAAGKEMLINRNEDVMSRLS
jgi:hypothetical protein